MPDTPEDKDRQKGDELLKRMLKTPPKPKRSDDKSESHADREKKPKD